MLDDLESTSRIKPANGGVRTLALLSTQFLGLDVMLYFLGTALVAVLRDRGVSLEQLALLGLAPIILMVYFLWAPAIDRYGARRLGHYMSWLLPCQIGLTASCVGMALLDPVADFLWIMVITLAAMAITSVHEPAANALVIQLVGPGRRSKANGMVMGCRYIGALAGGGGVLFLYPQWGWTPAMILVAVPNLLALIAVIPLSRLERARSPKAVEGQTEAATVKVGLRSLLTLFKDRAVAKWTLFGIPLYVMGYYVAAALVTPMLVDADYTLQEVGAIQVGLASIVGIAASLSAGHIGARLGTKRALLAFGLLRVAAFVALLPLANGEGSGLVVLAVVVMTVGETTGGTVLNTAIMDATRRASPGVDFSVQQAMNSLARILAAPIGLALAAAQGYSTVLICAGVVTLVGTIAAIRYQPPVSNERSAGH